MNIYDEAIELLNNTKTTVQVEDDSWMGVSEYEIKCVIDDTVYNALERAKMLEEFISLCYVETTDTGHEVVFWRDENYEYAKELLKILKGE